MFPMGQLRNAPAANAEARYDRICAFVRGLHELGRARSKVGETAHRNGRSTQLGGKGESRGGPCQTPTWQ